MNNDQQHAVKWLKDLLEQIESGECEVQELSREAGTFDYDDHATNMRGMLYTGTERVRLELVRPKKVEEFHKSRLALRDPDIPAFLHDRLEQLEAAKDIQKSS